MNPYEWLESKGEANVGRGLTPSIMSMILMCVVPIGKRHKDEC